MTGLAAKLKERAQGLKKQLLALYYAYRDPRLKILPRILIFIALGYALSPVDLIPDFIPVLGYLDDLILIPALIALSLRFIPPQIMSDARNRAEDGGFPLKRNWFFGILILMIWAVIAAAILKAVIPVLKTP